VDYFRKRRNVISLSNHQLQIVMTAAGGVPVEKCSVFLRWIAAHLQIRCGRFTDRDVAEAAQAALASLIQHAPAA
jgi:hypothetical protein